MVSFEELLKNKSFLWHPSFKNKVIDLRDLGEWAWEELNKKTPEYDENQVHWSIAISCLGKTEITKRIKEMKN